MKVIRLVFVHSLEFRSAGFRGQITLRIGGLPSGIQAPATTIIAPNEDRATFRLTADTSNIQAGGRGNLFVARTPGTGIYQIAAMGQLGRDAYLSSPAVTLRVLEDKEAKQPEVSLK